MAYDAARDRVVMFGGDDGTLLDDTWEWDGGDWNRRNPAVRPGPRARHGMTYDAARELVVLFGGTDDQTWEWDGSDWRRRSPATSPGVKNRPVLAYDADRERVVLFGGGDDESWEWDGGDWTRVAPPASPPAMVDHAMAYDAARREVVLVSDRIGVTLWTYRPTARHALEAFGTGCAGVAGVPELGAVATPLLGTSTFALRIGRARALAAAAIGVAPSAGNTPLPGGCTYLLGAGEFHLPTRTDAAGTATVDFPIPPDPALRGSTLAAQGIVLDPAGALLGIAALTGGLRVVAGD